MSAPLTEATQPELFDFIQPTATPLAGDPPNGAVITRTNISLRGEAADALEQLNERTRRRERMLNTVLSSMSDFTYILDRQGRFLFANQPLLDFWGITAEQANGRKLSDLGYPDDVVRKMLAQVLEVFETKGPVAGKRSYASPAGTACFLEYIFSPAFADDGSVDFVVGTTRDITERKRADTALHESEAEFRTLAEAMPQVVWVTRVDGGAGYFNRRWMEYTGLTLEESLGREWKKVMHPDDMLRAQEGWDQATAQARIYAMESRMRRADGVYRWWLIRAAPLLDAAGRIVKWFGTGTDIDELKTAELEVSRPTANFASSAPNCGCCST